MNEYFFRPGYSHQVVVLPTTKLTVVVGGAFVGTVLLVRQTSAQQSDQLVVHTFTAPGTYEEETPGSYRLHCSSFTSGPIEYSLDVDMTLVTSGETGGGGGAVDSVAGKTGVVTLVKADVGLGNADNTSDASKPVSTAQSAALALKADIGAIDTVADTTYTLLSADNGRRKRFTAATEVTVTIPEGLPANFEVTLQQAGLGQVVLAGPATINNVNSHVRLAGRYAVAALLWDATDVYTLSGSTGT